MAATALGSALSALRRSLLRRDAATLTDGELLERYVNCRDSEAFATLLHRHGPMVLGACRRLLHNESDVEDAFQATFLVLLRKAGSIRPRGMVGNWLYGVAHSTARKARALRNKRLAKERQAAMRTRLDVPPVEWEDIEAVLDQELQALPDRYRSAIVLCDLEGKTLREAGRDLGCPPATVGTRLARGRVLLARRLRRQGVTISSAALAVALSQHAASATGPSGLPGFLTLSATAHLMASTGTAGVASTTAGVLADSVVKSMLLAKLKVLSLLLVPVLIGMAGFAGSRISEPSSATAVVATSEPMDSNLTLPGSEEIDVGGAVVSLASTITETPKTAEPVRKKELPRGLAKKSERHPGRVAWLKTNGL